jgi:hypothetical protein
MAVICIDRSGPYLIIVLATGLMGALAGRLADPIAGLAVGALIGIGWGLLVGWMAAWLNRREGWAWKFADRSVLLAVLAATTLFGGSLFAMMLYGPALSDPEMVLGLMRPPLKGGLTFFLIFNTLMEWLVISAALYLNWHLPRRRALIAAGALLYYAARAWTYVYFVPNIFACMTTPAGAALSAELTGRVREWVLLSWIRTGIDGLLAVLFLLAAAMPGALDGGDGHPVAASCPSAAEPGAAADGGRATSFVLFQASQRSRSC